MVLYLPLSFSLRSPRIYLHVDIPFWAIHETSHGKCFSFLSVISSLGLYFGIVQYVESLISDIHFAFCWQKLRKEVEESQLKLAETKAKVQSLESKSGWFERRLAETEVCY